MHKAFFDAFELLQRFDGDSSEFYEHWWSGARGQISIPATPATFHPAVPALRIGNLGDRYIFSTGLEAVTADIGEFLLTDESRALICRRSGWSNSHWNWIQGVRVPAHPRADEILRIYVPSTSMHKAELSEAIRALFESASLEFTMKYRRSEGEFADAIVIWVDARRLKIAVSLVLDAVRSSSFLRTPPPLTRWVRGIGLAEHPSDGSSIGDNYARLLWIISKTTPASEYETKLIAEGINVKSPWRLNARKESTDWEMLVEQLD